jgi:predicted alpha/beta hydrolase family esterase
MAHITFIHGIGNKATIEDLVRSWQRELADGDGIDLGTEGVTAEMVYWADVMYESPSVAAGSYESVDTAMALDEPEVDVDFAGAATSVDEEAWLAGLRGKLNFDAEGDDEFTPPIEDIGAGFERIPLPWAVKRRLMKVFLRDVHHYLFNSESTPRPNEIFPCQDEIRRRFVEVVKRGAERPGPHIVIAHSMGTVISYDCLKRVDDCPAVDGLITIGSPLGLDEIQDKLQPGWTRDDGFPHERVRTDWVNVYDRLDPVAGLDPAISNDYRRAGEDVVIDVHQSNPGAWRHDAGKYLRGAQFREQLSRLLEVANA